MALEFQAKTIPLVQGLDTKIDPKQLQLGKLTAIRNLQFDELGNLSPRYGQAALTQSIVNTGTIAAGRTLSVLNASLVLGDGNTLYSYAESLAKWSPKGMKVCLDLTTFPVSGAAVNASVQDSARHSGGAAIYTWVNSSTGIVSYSVLDTNTQATIVQEGTQATGTNAKPCVIGANASFTVFLQVAGNIAYESITLANPAIATGASNLVAITSGSAPFDACTGSVFAYLFYVNSGGDLAVTRVNATNTVVNTVTLTGETATSVTCWYDTTNNYVWLMWYTGTSIKYAVYTSALVQVLSATTIATESSSGSGPYLGTAARFALLAASTITNTGFSVVTGDLGLYPGTSVTGFPPGTVSGTQHIADAVAAQAQIDATAAYTAMQAMAATTIPSALDGQTLGPGVYEFASGAATLATSAPGVLTFNGDANAVFIIKTASTLTTGAGGAATFAFTGGASASNVYWAIGSSATLNVGVFTSTFVGHLIAQASVTVTSGGISTVNGTLAALTGAITLSAATTITASEITTSSVTRLTGALTSGTTSTIYYEVAGTTNADNITNVYTLTASGITTPISLVRSVGLAGKAFTYNAVTYAVAVHDSELQSTYFLIRPLGFNSYEQATVVGKLAPLNAGGTPTLYTCTNTYAIAANKFSLAYLIQVNPTTLSGVVQSSLSIQSASFEFSIAGRPDLVPPKLALANNMHLGGALITNYDSGSSTEHGFNLFPEGGSTHQPLTLGGMVDGGTYNYRFTYEWIDEFGQVHRSAPSTGLEYLVAPIPIRASDNGTTTSVNLTIELDATTPTRFVYVGAIIDDSFAVFAANTTIASITDDNTIVVTPADVGPTFNIPAILESRKTFAYAVGSGSGNQIGVTKPTVLVANATLTSGSPEIFVAVTEGLAVGQAITDNTGDIPAATTISSFVYKNGGAVITMSASATATYANALVNITHATGWPITLWLHVGQIITGSGIPASTLITEIEDATATSALLTVSEDIPNTASGTLTVAGYYTSKITVPTLRVTEKGRDTQPVQIAVWRTANGGTQWYKVGYAVNDTTVDSVTFYDYTSDDDLVGNTPLYTNGGEVENIAPPASAYMTSYKNRVILIPSEDKFEWWYSKQVIQGTPVEFSDLFKQSIDQKGGPMTAASQLDDKLVFFKERDIFYVNGDGPAPSGANNDFSYPQSITTPCGCTEAKSVITIPTGIIFKSDKGFYLLDRGLSVSYIGAEVEEFNDHTVTAAVMSATGTQVRFSLTNTHTLVYDYYSQQWSRYDNTAATDAVIYNDEYTYTNSLGLILYETPGLYSDNGVVIPTSFTLGWVSFAQVQNFQRLWAMFLLGDYQSPHTATIVTSVDFVNTTVQTTTATFTTAPTPYELRLPIINQKSGAHRFTVSCTPADTTGGGAVFSNIGFEFGVKKGLNKRPASQTYGGAAS